MSFKRPIARRDAIGLSVIGLCLVGAAIVGILLLTGDDDGDGTRTTITTTDITDPESRAPSDPGTAQDNVQARPPRRAPRRPVPVPEFSASVVERGKLPPPVAKIGDALADGTLTADELDGTPTVLTAVSSRCDFCGPEAKLLEAEWKRWGPRGVLYLALSVRESADSARVFAQQNKLTFPVVSDPAARAAREFRLSGVPETVFISDTGRIVGRVVGGATIGQLEAGSSAARSNRPFGVHQGGARIPL
jgi:hypothetical protein